MDLLGDYMILVILGTNDKKFTRLLKEVDRLIQIKKIREEVIVQAGFSSDYKSNNMKIFDLIENDEFTKLMKKANFIITHGGVGTILTGLTYSKKMIAIARLKKYKEHVNDHQIQLIDNFKEDGYIIGIDDVSELENALDKINDFYPKKYKSNQKNMEKLVERLIEK